MASHSSILAWRILWTEETGWLWSVGLQRVGYAWSNLAYTHTHTHTHTLSLSLSLSLSLTRMVFPVGKSSGDHIWNIVFCNHSICFEWMPPLSLRLLPRPSASLTLNALLVIDTLGISTTLKSSVLRPCFTHTFVLYYFRFTSLASDNTTSCTISVSWGLSCQHQFGSLPPSFFAKHQINGFCQRKP